MRIDEPVDSLTRWLGLLLVVASGIFLSGCIKPVTEEATPGAPTMTPGANQQPAVVQSPVSVAGAVSSQALVQQFIAGRGDSPGNLLVFYDQPRGPDQLAGFTYTNVSGASCAGFLLTAMINGVWQPNNGAILCAQQVDMPAAASVSLFATTDGQPYTVVVGRVTDPTISAIAAVYDDGSNQVETPVQGGFLLVKPGISAAQIITAVNQEGNTVIDNIPQLPAS